jgi:hypothetical protein
MTPAGLHLLLLALDYETAATTKPHTVSRDDFRAHADTVLARALGAHITHVHVHPHHN